MGCLPNAQIMLQMAERKRWMRRIVAKNVKTEVSML
jgi:hypothetical protein